MLICAGIIAIIKMINIISGFVVEKRFVAVYSVMNKITGGFLFVLPLTVKVIYLSYGAAIVCATATFAAIQEGHYYPNFLTLMEDRTYQLTEVKGDKMIDDAVVKAKAEVAEEMSIASGMRYKMYASSILMKQNVLEHPPVTYSYESSILSMVAEDSTLYGK